MPSSSFSLFILFRLLYKLAKGAVFLFYPTSSTTTASNISSPSNNYSNKYGPAKYLGAIPLLFLFILCSSDKVIRLGLGSKSYLACYLVFHLLSLLFPLLFWLFRISGRPITSCKPTVVDIDYNIQTLEIWYSGKSFHYITRRLASHPKMCN